MFIRILFIFFFTLFISACNSDNQQSKKEKVSAPVSPTSEPLQATEDATNKMGEKSSSDLTKAPFNWQKVRGWHTNGTISRNSPIRVYFNRDIISKDQVGKDASKVIHIDPAIKGSAVFESQSKIAFLPDEPLKPGTQYKVTIKPDKLKDIPSKASPFQFTFNVIPLEFEVKTMGLTSTADDENKMVLSGELYVSDRVDSEALESVIKASLQGKSLPVKWTHDRNGKKHRFTINGITKETFATDVKLSWNGKPINIDSHGSQDIAVPSVNDFKLLGLSIVQDAGSNPYIQARFSDELDKQQNLKGLVQLAKQKKYKIRLSQNVINIYPNKNLTGKYTIRFNEGIRSKNNKKVLKKSIEKSVTFGDTKPQVKFVGNGSILPENSILEIPFKAVGVNAVDVTAFEIYPDNMRQFLQVNNYSGGNETGRVGRYLWRKTIPLTPANPNQWNRYSFDATELVKKHRGGLIRLTLSIKRRHSTYHCSGEYPKAETRPTLLKDYEDNNSQQASGWDGISDYVEDSQSYDYDWDNRNDPCTDSYFTFNEEKTRVSQNFIASNIGLIAKRDAKGKLRIISTDIRTAEPLTGVNLEVRNFQGQVLGKATSDGSGFAEIDISATPFLLVAKKFDDTAYLKLNAKTALSVSHFDVGGAKVQKGIKGYIYGERGVWRPGDNIYLTFVMQDKSGKVPENHPVTMKLIDPQGRVVDSKTSTNSVGGFYAFKFKTKEKDQTGRWMVKAFLGGSTFSKALMIETVRPNRLKIELSFDNEGQQQNKEPVLYSSGGPVKGTLFSQWLHGATASNLKADIKVRFKQKKTRFGRFSDYAFDDPSRHLNSEETTILEGRLDDKGYLKFEKDIKPDGKPAGMLRANFTSRVFEEGGAFSISSMGIDYHPYENYVGIKLPKGDATRGMLLTDKTHTVKIGSLSAKGEPVSLKRVKVSLYKVSWKWWWDKSSKSLAEFADSKSTRLLQSSEISTLNGNGEWKFEIKYPDWGRYFVRACDLEGKHCSGKIVYIDWPGWAGRAQEEGSGAASRLNLFSDKPAYSVGETAHIQLPTASQGRALLSIETGSNILDQRWIDLASAANAQGKLQVDVPITAEMAPNAYVHISMLQPHKDKTNDRPIRLYGIIPLEVSNPETYLKPGIEAADEWKPQSKQTIKVTETNGKAMNYTLAVVDEGLLGLTAFKTPNLHRYFYSKEALGIKTWDLYDHVIGAYGGKLERMLALGGGDDADVDNEDSKKRRFPPVVKFMGPFHLEAGKTVEHEITLPAYLGAVRVMLVAGEQGAYGKAQKSIFVRQDLMLQASLPRTLGPDEEVDVPVTLFATNDKVKDVTVAVKTNDLIQVVGDATRTIKFDKSGEKIVFIKLKTAKQAGKAHVQFIASTTTDKGEQTSESDTYLDINLANQETSRSVTKVIEPDSSWNAKGDAFGLKGTNKATLELSSVPALNLDKRLNYLIRYPHGCLEQTTSSVFPQLYLSNIMKLDEKRQKKTQHLIAKGIDRLQRFQKGSGDFSYWPGGHSNNDWASVYAGHFLVEAQKAGYMVPASVLSDWINYQIETAQAYTAGSAQYSHVQAYRLYVLALAGKPQLGAMNRLREQGKTNPKVLNNKARWLLASAYQTASQPDAAKAVIQGLLPEVSPVDKPDKTFSSTLGDMGLQLESLVALNKKQDANKLLESIAAQMSSDDYQSTQGIAWALMGVSRYLGGDTSHFTAMINEAGKTLEINSGKALFSVPLTKPDDTISVKNSSAIKLFATLSNSGIPDAGVEKSIAQGFKLYVTEEVRQAESSDKDTQWKAIQNNVSPQGSDVRYSVTIENTSNHTIENIALTIPVAAGMEIMPLNDQPKADKYDYRDLRDDRIHYYFSLAKGKTKRFQLVANAAYKGRYYQPAINVEAMYEGNMKARQQGKWITIAGKQEAQQQFQTAASAKAASIIDTEQTIKSLKAYLFDSPDDSTQTKMYLVTGDRVKVLNEVTDSNNNRWLYIHFEGKNPLEKWIKVETIK